MGGKAFIAVVVGWALIGLAAAFSQFGELIVAAFAAGVAMATAPAWLLLSFVAPNADGSVNYPLVIGLTLGLAGLLLAFFLYCTVRAFLAGNSRRGFGYAALSLTLAAPFVLASPALFGPALPV